MRIAPGLPAWEGLRRFGGIVAGCAAAGRSAFQRALDQLLAVRRDMERQPLMKDWHLNMPLQWGLTEAWLAKGDVAQARLEGELFSRSPLQPKSELGGHWHLKPTPGSPFGTAIYSKHKVL